MVTPRTVLDLFSGIGGFSLGLEWTGGYRTVGFCEACPKARKILDKRWPRVQIFDDVRTLDAETIHERCGRIDLVCGGFPCQDISLAGKGEGLEGKRSGLWFEMLRIIKATRPRYVIAENVSALRSRGLDRVLGSLAEIGYDAEWHCIPASAVGAPHRRDRVWIIAFPNADRDRESALPVDGEALAVLSEPVADSEGDSWRSGLREAGTLFDRDIARDGGSPVSDADRGRSPERRERSASACEGDGRGTERAGSRADAREVRMGSAGQGAGDVPDAGRISAQVPPTGIISTIKVSECNGWWSSEPDVGRVAHGVPGRVDRLKQLGNAVVPHIPYLIGKALLGRW